MNWYPVLYSVVRVALWFWHPVFRVTGRENIPEGQPLVICANHSGMADPIWLLFALKQAKSCPRIIAKESVMRIPILGKILASFGVFGVRRDENDVRAVKEALSSLKSGKSLMLFPEGTRVKPGKTVVPKNGAVLFAHRTGTPILPVWLEPKRFPFSPMRCVIGQPWLPQTESGKATQEDLRTLTGELMNKIYTLGENP